MFMVSESEAESIRRIYETEGELSAVIELRRHFPGITDHANARRWRANPRELELIVAAAF